jgi:hypothetical protein
LQHFPGWKGAFTRAQAEGALPNGTRVRKTGAEPADAHPNGAEAVILGSIAHPAVEDFALYFVEWDSHPRHAVAVANHRIEPVKASPGTGGGHDDRHRIHRNP